ncbi:hypothetical protein EJB05_37655, partial [Eragrostis curvula]
MYSLNNHIRNNKLRAGFPGDLDAYVTHRLSSPYVLGMHMNATVLNKVTPVNLLQHTYWNLGRQGSGDVLGHTLQLFVSRYIVVDEERLPSSGRVAPVAGTPLDFRAPAPIGARIGQVTGGRPRARVRRGLRRVRRAMELWANQPAVHLYTANWLNNTEGKAGKVYGPHSSFCLETQGYPDAVNHHEFPSQTLRPGQVYNHDMLFKFSF